MFDDEAFDDVSLPPVRRRLPPVLSITPAIQFSTIAVIAIKWSSDGKDIRSFPLNSNRFQIGMLAVLALVALRLALGCHFLYEGTWKIDHTDFVHAERWKADKWRIDGHEAFTARPFLALAKGPVSGLFYMMLPDIDGRERLKVVVDPKTGKNSIDGSSQTKLWEQVRQDFANRYRPTGSSDDKLIQDTKKTYEKFQKQFNEYLAENADDIAAYFQSLDRFQSDAEHNELGQDAPFQKQRHWDEMMKLRGEADKWVKDIEGQERAYANSLYSLLNEEDRKIDVPADTWNPLKWDRMKQLNVMVTFSLFAIGLCLMLGFFTPLAALGGAAFMFFVVMTQPAFPTIFPHDPPVVGHALLVNKDFVEAVALLVVAATGAGRWGGLDFFVLRWFVHPICAWWNKGKGEKK